MPKYNHISNIPAKLFFEVLKSQDFTLLLPTLTDKIKIRLGNKQLLKSTFSKIYDDFFTQTDSQEGKRYLQLINEISFLHYKINTLTQTLHFYYYNETTEQMRKDFAQALKEGYGINLNLTVPLADEVHRILTQEIGFIKNDLSFAQIEFDEMINRSKSKDFDYYEAIVGIANVLQGNNLVKEEMTLAIYVSLEKSAKKINDKQIKKAA